MSPSFSALLGGLKPAAGKAMGCVNITWGSGHKKDGLSVHTVDGRNPTPVDRWFIHVYAIIYGFNHP